MRLGLEHAHGSIQPGIVVNVVNKTVTTGEPGGLVKTHLSDGNVSDGPTVFKNISHEQFTDSAGRVGAVELEMDSEGGRLNVEEVELG
jgi:hypothetical protein